MRIMYEPTRKLWISGTIGQGIAVRLLWTFRRCDSGMVCGAGSLALGIYSKPGTFILYLRILQSYCLDVFRIISLEAAM